MSETEITTEVSGWTKENLQKLFAHIKSSIPKRFTMIPYYRSLKRVDWEKVAFPPFSPEACRDKWTQILQTMHKTRTLTELVSVAEEVLLNPVWNSKLNPEVPKKPTPPSGIFCEKNWTMFREQHPELNEQKLVALMGNKYKVLPDEEKAQYVEEYHLATQEYKRIKLEFRQHHISTKSKSKRKRKNVPADTADGEQHTKIEKGLPPKPPFGYNLFCKEQLPSMAGDSSNVRVWGQCWRELTEEQKHEYNIRCRELKREYNIKLNEYLDTFDKEKQVQILNETGIKRPKRGIHRNMKLKKKYPGEPKMPSRCSNVIFCQNQMELLKKEIPNSKERFGKINKMWKDLPLKEKEFYKEKLHEKFREYSMELQKWFKTLSAKEQQAYRKSNPTKCQYLCDKNLKGYDKEELCQYRPSDSEDSEVTEVSSSDEEQYNMDYDEDEEEEGEEGDATFEVY
uniref:nucleolar transcription factor 1-like isoform X2 n=1 Tax=Monopterus albus TaxID=43700 RepID=UPI0009B30DF9|nr:nucleolar transcription factor 1-like isoform X2 [Monopterus albus]